MRPVCICNSTTQLYLTATMMATAHNDNFFTSTSNTFKGCRLLIDSLTCPSELDNVRYSNQHWAAAMMAMAAHRAHQDSNHYSSDLGLHPLTVAHYSSGINAEATQDDRINHSRSREDHLHHIHCLIFDLVTFPFGSQSFSNHVFFSAQFLIDYLGILHWFCIILVTWLHTQT